MTGIVRIGAVLLTLAGLAVAASAEDNPIEQTSAPEERPQVFSFENFPFPVRVPEGLNALEPVAEPFEYNRRLPVLGKEAADRGIRLPKPWGLSILGVRNNQVSTIDDLSVALSFDGTTPPPDTQLIEVDFVRMGDSDSETNSSQFKVDLWVLPFLNVYATRGRVTGEADLEVTVDLDEWNEQLPLPTGLPWCGGPRQDPCGEVGWGFSPRIDSDTYTLGIAAIKNWNRTIATLNASYTFSDSRKDTAETVIEVAVLGGRVGRLYDLRGGMTFTPYVGVTYNYSDNIVRGTTSSPDPLPNGEPLIVRFETRQKNKSNWAFTTGFSFGINETVSAILDINASENLQRAAFGVTARF